jgi:hypothetical protein
MCESFDEARLLIIDLDYINFSAIGPRNISGIGALHPERRPQAASGGKLNASREDPVLLLKQPVGLHAS